MTQYVLGFIFNKSLDKVFLTLKNRGAEINIGKLNGIGGKVNADEDINQAIERESLEETGQSFSGRWLWVGGFQVDFEFVHIYKVQANSLEGNLHQVNDVGEHQKWMEVHSVLTGQCISDIAENAKTMIVHSLYGNGDLSIKKTEGTNNVTN